jgi:hypothetical protein
MLRLTAIFASALCFVPLALTQEEHHHAISEEEVNALYGAAQAAEASGDASTASGYFRNLTEIAVGDERPELKTARQKVVAEKAQR